MSNIKLISDLHDYNEVLKDFQNEEYVFITKSGRGIKADLISFGVAKL